MTVFALVAGGGTGGHVYPAIALGRALVAGGHPPSEIRFVGARRGLEATAVPAAGFEIDLLPGRGLQRRWTVENVRALWENARALWMALRIVARTRPQVVVGVGGYASLPTVLAAWLARVPIVVHEQNAAPGLANRIAARLGARVAVAIPGTPLPRATVTGNPVREEVLGLTRSPRDDRTLLAVFGGSLGARRINDAVIGCYDRWRGRTDLAVRHVTGRRDHAECTARVQDLRRDGDEIEYDLVEYENDMAGLYAAAALAVCRAGAVTVAELAVAGVPAVLVPLPGAPGDHQGANARAFADAGGAVVLPDAECDADGLAAAVEPLLADPARRSVMARAARSFARPDAAMRLAAMVEESARAA